MKSPFEIQKRKDHYLSPAYGMSGSEYMQWGASLMVLKYTIDTLVSTYIFHHAWTVWSYFVPSMEALSTAEAWFYARMLILALPFALTGSLLTLRRLKTIGLPPWMVILFYTPFINMIFFMVLAVVKTPASKQPLLRTEGEMIPERLIGADEDSREQPALDSYEQNANPDNALVDRQTQGEQRPIQRSFPGERYILSQVDRMPVHGPRAFMVAALLPVPVSVLAAMFSVTVLGVYGWNIFIAVPFVAAIAAPVLYGWNQRRGLVECVGCAVICLFIMACALLVIPFEGIICLAMASPLAVGVGIIGGLVGYAIQASMPRNEGVPRMLGCFVLFIPMMMIGEFIAPIEYPVYENVSRIEIDAPPDVVWKYLINFPRLKEPTEYLFKTGIAYPIEAKITGHGPGAIRQCIFTTGEFVEPIEIWDEPKLLRFGVLEQAPPMHELSLYPALHPPHLDHYLVAKQGQFRLIESAPNHTRLFGSTWYQNCMGPGPYWRLWSDWIIHSIHMRVLNHVKTLAETEYAHATLDHPR